VNKIKPLLSLSLSLYFYHPNIRHLTINTKKEIKRNKNEIKKKEMKFVANALIMFIVTFVALACIYLFCLQDEQRPTSIQPTRESFAASLYPLEFIYNYFFLLPWSYMVFWWQQTRMTLVSMLISLC
jgi:hypothetical protein